MPGQPRCLATRPPGPGFGWSEFLLICLLGSNRDRHWGLPSASCMVSSTSFFVRKRRIQERM